jgi:two-component system, chemotaxis family, chemotaxis protein CheY
MNAPPLVMIVDDDADLRETVADVLDAHGYRVLTAENGAIALEILERSSELPALILLDMMMPVMDGWAFCKEKSERPRLAPIPIVVFSAHVDTQAAIASLGAVGSLAKPPRVQQLLEVVAGHVG